MIDKQKCYFIIKTTWYRFLSLPNGNKLWLLNVETITSSATTTCNLTAFQSAIIKTKCIFITIAYSRSFFFWAQKTKGKVSTYGKKRIYYQSISHKKGKWENRWQKVKTANTKCAPKKRKNWKKKKETDQIKLEIFFFVSNPVVFIDLP